MAIDTTPSTVATKALQALPFSSLIGGPLDACVQAQAQAALTSWEFIQNVGLYEQAGEKKAVTVTFQYQKGGEMVNLMVPLLTIVPIPYIAIDKITIDFEANISAASSSVSEESSSESTEAAGRAEGKIKLGPFSLKGSFKANYSSKKDSKASKESKYSVEYTMKVHVDAGQADMPAGLGAILNILQSSISEANPKGTITASPTSGELNPNNQDSKGLFQFVLTDQHALLLANHEVSFEAENTKKEELTIKVIKESGETVPEPDVKGNTTTDSSGIVTLEATLVKYEGEESKVVMLVVKSKLPGRKDPKLVAKVPITILKYEKP